MKRQTEIAVRDGNFFVINNEMKEPRTKGQQKLLAYIHQSITLGNSADDLEIRKIYFKYGMQNNGYWQTSWSGEGYHTSERCTLDNPGCAVSSMMNRDRICTYYPSYWKEYKIDDYHVKEGAKNWLNRNIGSLVKCGFLIVIPKGYILQRIEESKK